MVTFERRRTAPTALAPLPDSRCVWTPPTQFTNRELRHVACIRCGARYPLAVEPMGAFTRRFPGGGR